MASGGRLAGKFVEALQTFVNFVFISNSDSHVLVLVILLFGPNPTLEDSSTGHIISVLALKCSNVMRVPLTHST